MSLERERTERTLDRARTRELPRTFAARDLEAVRDIGDFGVVRPRDLAKVRYDGDHGGIENLTRGGYVKRYTVIDERIRTNEPLEVLVLTPRSRTALRRIDPERPAYLPVRDGQLNKRRDLAHDASVYPAVQRMKNDIEKDGGTVRRVVLGVELAGQRARLANRETWTRPANTRVDLKRQREIAEALDLKVVHGRVLIPDARVIYQDRDGEERKLDLEVTTPQYDSRDKAAKSKAGFHLVPGVSFTHGRTTFHER